MALDILRVNDPEGAHPASWYAATADLPPPHPQARGDLRADVCVVGGGYTGLSAALHLRRAGRDVVLIEANRLGSGASGRNGGQVGTGQRLEQPELERLVGMDDARKLWDLGLEAVALVRALAAEATALPGAGPQADPGYRPGILHANHRARFTDASRAHVDHMAKTYGYDQMCFLNHAEMRETVGSPGYHSGVLDLGGGHLHPLRFALGLAQLAATAGVRLHEHSRMVGRSGTTVCTDAATIRADQVMLALNGYHNDAEPAAATRIMPINNFIAATAPLPQEVADTVIRGGYAVADSRFVVNYFRLSADNRLLLGGGESYGWRFPRDIAAKVRRPLTQVFPQLARVPLDYAWGGTLGITGSRLPWFDRLDPGVFGAGGFSGHGVAMGTLAGRMLAEAATGDPARFELMARLPTPRFPGGALRTPLLAAAMTWYALRDRL